ncbi:MAG: glucans biosynthesis protein [Alphaproteobacteria bacterium]|nr:MAG: glucans biosynthesis protein [Alphaproteobacteria bacterium]
MVGGIALLGLLVFAPAQAWAGESAAAPKQEQPVKAEAVTPEMLYETVAEKARALAGKPYTAPPEIPSDKLGNLTYEDFQKIRFRKEAALWHDQALFEVQFFHPGFLYKSPVIINTLEDGKVAPIPFRKSSFRYDGEGVEDKVPDDLGYAGFRIQYPLNSPGYKDELAVFLGASYFRLLARNQYYGLSARGLAVDTALPKGEEFPAFREFWLVKPARDATSMTLFALLDSPSVTGAYRFIITPGTRTVVDVDTALFQRDEGHQIGIAPLTSMFLYGENSTRRFDDFRPEVHDSDGLLMYTGSDEWIWRPLTNPKKLSVSAFMDNNPRGFGLLQRDRNYNNYLDFETHYHRRPSLWIEPTGKGWGKGSVHLVEIPSNEEVNDNIVAFWVFDSPLSADQATRLSYRMTSLDRVEETNHLAHVLRTRTGWGGVPGTKPPAPKSVRRFMIDFQGGDLASLNPEQPVKPEYETTNGKIDDLVLHKLPGTDIWRLSFRLQGAKELLADMRVFLTLRGKRLTETWSYLYEPIDAE